MTETREKISHFEKSKIVEILVEGFLDDPFYVWTTPDERVRDSLLRSLFSLAVDAAYARGFLWLDERGVVVLLPPGARLYDRGEAARVQSLIRESFQRPAALLDDYQRRLRAADPGDEHAWYLQYLVVPAAERSRGRGGSLMRSVLAQASGAALWLHTGRPSNLRFYRRFGLEVVATTPCQPGGPDVYTLRGEADLDLGALCRFSTDG